MGGGAGGTIDRMERDRRISQATANERRAAVRSRRAGGSARALRRQVRDARRRRGDTGPRVTGRRPRRAR